MKKTELYKIIKQSLKEVITERVRGGGDGSIGINPGLEPADQEFLPNPPPQLVGCAADPQYSLGLNYVDYGDFTAQLLETANFGTGVCQTVTIPQDYICCSATNDDH